jgi:hypothetical protein
VQRLGRCFDCRDKPQSVSQITSSDLRILGLDEISANERPARLYPAHPIAIRIRTAVWFAGISTLVGAVKSLPVAADWWYFQTAR